MRRRKRMTSRTESGPRLYDAMGDPSRTCARCTHLVTCTVNRGVYRQLMYDYPQVTADALRVTSTMS